MEQREKKKKKNQKQLTLREDRNSKGPGYSEGDCLMRKNVGKRGYRRRNEGESLGTRG